MPIINNTCMAAYCNHGRLPNSSYCLAHQFLDTRNHDKLQCERTEERKAQDKLYDSQIRKQNDEALKQNAGYNYKSKEWKALRQTKIKANPNCERCDMPAKLVHHVLDVKSHPELFLEIDNLQSLCASCHAKIHYHSGTYSGNTLFNQHSKKRNS